MNSIFLRIYGGMLAVLVLVALLAALALHQINQVRGDAYRERLARGTFSLMADNLKPMNELDRRRALVLWQRLLGIPLELQPVEAIPLASSELSRLLDGVVLVEGTGPHAAKVFRLVSGEEQLVLVGDVQQVSEQLARATIYLLSDELVRFPQADQARRLADLKQSKQFGFDLRLRSFETAELDDDQRRRITEGDTVMALGAGGDSIRVFAGLAGASEGQLQVLEIGPLYPMNPYPPQLLMLICLIGLFLIGGTGYLLVRQLERRLSGLAGAATHISKGNLDTRVPDSGADSIGRLASAFNGMAEHLQRSLSIQREMVRAVSHELRTPVARLRFGLEMLGSAGTDQAREKYRIGMDSDIQDLDLLVDEMLTYARLEQGAPPLDFQSVDLAVLLDQVVAELAPLRASVSVVRGPCQDAADGAGAQVEAEPRYLHRAVQNLLSNALRHADTQVRVSYKVGQVRCRIDIEDDGPGVPTEAWERVFTPFLRLDDSRTRASGGHGLGLSIVRRIVHWHSGRAQIDRSLELGGASFSLVWPRRQEKS